MMDDFIMEFLDWLSDIWNTVIDSIYEATKTALELVVVILTIPILLLPFLVWLVFVKLKGGDE
jgi:phage-related protein